MGAGWSGLPVDAEQEDVALDATNVAWLFPSYPFDVFSSLK